MYEHINVNYFNNTRIQLKLKIHQKMTEKMMSIQIKNKNKMFCIAHKPRSGKSITILNISKSLFVYHQQLWVRLYVLLLPLLRVLLTRPYKHE